jgi:dihydroorotate dehydrogenase electron transfer subunit
MNKLAANGSSLHTPEQGDCRSLGRVKDKGALGGMVRLVLEVPGWRGARPGQFALVQPEKSCCFLGRALSVSAEAEERVSFLVAPVGEGTRELSGLADEDAVWVLGPLGNGFDVDALATGPGRTVIVGGGVGVAPFPLLLSRLAERHAATYGQPATTEASGPAQAYPEILVLLGFRDADQARGAEPLQETAALAGHRGLRCRLEVATEDGSRGPAEKVTDLLERHLQPGDRLAVCGPEAMAKAVWRICAAARDVEAWFSLEANMACGVGSCHGCVIRLADGSYARVCHDGPVFAGKEVFGG